MARFGIFTIQQDAESCQDASRLILTATMEQMEQAIRIARARTAFHDGRRKANQDAGGASANIEADLRGLLSELLIKDALRDAGIAYAGFCLLAQTGIAEPDFSLRGQSYEVKTTRTGSSYVAINERQRLAFARSFPGVKYLAARMRTGDSIELFAPVPSSVVAAAELRQLDGRAAYRSIPIADMKPLRDLRQLLPGWAG